eukprot:12842332-Ditylum_brightwellii.AAC.1
MATPHAHLDLPDADYHRQEMLNKKAQLKGKRRVKITAGATSGAIVGGLILLPAFPLGMVLGGTAGAVITSKVSKHKEKKKLKELDAKLMANNHQRLMAEDTCIS